MCPACDGSAVEFSDEAEAVPCVLCNGTGWPLVVGDLGPTHSAGRRVYAYRPGVGRLTVRAGKAVTRYAVAEFQPDAGFEGRAFRLVGDHGEVYSLLVGPRVSCDCPAFVSAATARANDRASWEERPVYRSLGCKHADCLVGLLEAGWLDLPEVAVRQFPGADDE